MSSRPRRDPAVGAITLDPVRDERRGRRWLALSFLACPCHLPWTLALLGTVLGGTALGAVLHDHRVLAGVIIGSVWLAGTARGLLLVRRAERGELSCAIPAGAAAGRTRSRRTIPVAESGHVGEHHRHVRHRAHPDAPFHGPPPRRPGPLRA